MSLRPAAALSTAALAQLFNECYADYFVPVRVTEDALASMIEVQDIDLVSSRIADLDGAPAAFAFLGVRGRRGWIGGMGTVPQARRRGLGRAALISVLEAAWGRGLLRVELEVLVENKGAAGLYSRLGFLDQRQLEVWERPADAGPPALARDLDDRAAGVEALPLAACRALRLAAAIEPLPWQRDLPVQSRLEPALEVLGLRDGAAVLAFAVCRPAPTGLQLMDLLAAPGAPEWALAAVAVAALRRHPDSHARMLNLPARDPAAPVLAALGFRITHRQREMAIDLSL